MDFKLLNSLIIEKLADLPINKFNTSFSSTITLAEHHLHSLKDCQSEKIGKYTIRMKYNDESFGSIAGQIPNTNRKISREITKDKMETERYLKDFGVRTTDSIVFNNNQYEEAERFIRDSNNSYVFKPNNLNGGRGITLQVNKENFKKAWDFAESASNSQKKKLSLLVQEFIPGIETRFLIIEKKFNSAILRVPANVMGNGKSTISELIDEKNKLRKLNPHLKVLSIKVDERVKDNLNQVGLSLESIPNMNQIVYLHKSSNISLGGDSYEISHLVNEEMKDIAEQAVAAIPGLSTAGVDMIYQSLEDKNPLVLELNADANLRMHHYPYKGEPKQPVFDLIDILLKRFKEIE